METDDMTGLPGSIDFGYKNENDELSRSDLGPTESRSQPCSNEGKESKDDEEDLELCEGVVEIEEGIVDPGCSGLNVDDTGTEEAATDQSNLVLEESEIGSKGVQFAVETEADMVLVDSPVRQVNFEVVDAVIVSKKPNISSINFEDCFLDTPNNSLVQQGKVDGSRILSKPPISDNLIIYCKFSYSTLDELAVYSDFLPFLSCIPQSNMPDISGVKRKRMTNDEQEPSVHVMYNSLTRASKQRLEELLQQWSEWHGQHNSSHDTDEMLQSGEDTYFPALRVGMEKSSAVSFWIENQARKQEDNDLTLLHSNSVPLYDRGYVLGLTSADGPINIEGGLEIVDAAARCFNCGSYNHSLKECSKPRDNAAVNSARKQLKIKRNQNSSSRNPTRYYQSSSGGKYDGLKPGSLDTETQQLLGLGELDPPPWLNRMRELGYPPGYLEYDWFDLINVLSAHEALRARTHGDIIELVRNDAWANYLPHPDDEDQPSGITIFADGDVEEEQEDGEIMETDHPEPSRKMSIEFPGINAPIPANADQRLWEVGPSSSDPFRHRSRHRSNHSSEATGRWHHHEQRQYRDFINDGPPGVDSVFSPSMSSYPPRYGHHDSSYSSDSPRDLSPALGRSNSDRGRTALVYEDFVSHGSSSHSSSRKRSSPQNIGSARYQTNNSRDDYDMDYSYRDYSFRSEYDNDRHRRRSRR
ncbi:hypothetical protein DKX38_027216 [Salix brachista]|uniref:CCHC-type domain-containing protein n=1 Tax=Salix brachista TaxID=2182728 RepID=A0A5N5JBH1_9ROSI|nr:hypothetical protein DKX38_027216 [Salix brachista]